MNFILRYLYFYYKLALRTRDRFKAPGLVLLGKLGDRIYKSPIVVIVYAFASAFILVLPAGYSVEVLPTDPSLGLNFTLLVPSFLLTQIMFDWFAQNKQLSSYQKLYVINGFSIKERVQIILLTEFFGIKLLALILCIGIIFIFNAIYLGIYIPSVFILIFFLSIFNIYNSIIVSTYKFIRRVNDKFFILLFVVLVLASIFAPNIFLGSYSLDGTSFGTEVYAYLLVNQHLILGLFFLSLLFLSASYFIIKISLKNLW